MSTGRPPAPEVASITTSWPVDRLGGPHDRHATPVEVSLWAQARTSQDGSACGSGAVPGSALTTTRVGEERRALRGLGELRGELAVGEVQRALADQAERRGVPERRGAAVAEDDLVARGQRRTAPRGPPAPAPTSDFTGFCRCEVPMKAARGGQRGELLGAHLGGSAAEAPVGGLEVGGDREVGGRGSCHRFSLPPSVWGSLGRADELDGRAARHGRACQDVRDRSTRGSVR